MNNGRDARVSAMANALARLGHTEEAYRQALADSFTLTNQGAPDEVADARWRAAEVLSGPAQVLCALGQAEANCRQIISQWYELRRSLSQAETELAEEQAAKRYPRSEQARATLDALDEAVRDERERCAALAEGAGMPGLARVLRMDPMGSGKER